MHRISAVEYLIFLCWFLIASFAIRTTTSMIIERNPNSKVGAALAYIH